MLIGIDGNEANIKDRVGIGQYAYNLLTHIYKLDKKNNYIIYLKNPPLSDLPKPSKNGNIKSLDQKNSGPNLLCLLNYIPKPNPLICFSHLVTIYHTFHPVLLSVQ